MVYLLIGMALGDYMGANEDFTLKPVHAHINLLGFALMAIFAAIYKVFPAMAASKLATYHFFLHQVGALTLMIGFYLFFSGPVDEAVLLPFIIISDIGLFGGTAVFGWNAVRNAH